jgi:hypothetical protein
MTEGEWVTCTDPGPMLELLRSRGGASERKLRLFVVAGYRLFLWHLPVDQSFHEAVAVAERFADGLATLADLEAAKAAADQAMGAWQQQVHRKRKKAVALPWVGIAGRAVSAAAAPPAWLSRGLAPFAWHCWIAATRAFAEAQSGRPTKPTEDEAWNGCVLLQEADQEAEATNKVREEGVRLLRDLFNPFQAPLDPTWLGWNDGLVVKLAQAAYEEGSLSSGRLNSARLAILADALLDAGCTGADLLAHLRSPEPHVLGCHVLDAVLGKG